MLLFSHSVMAHGLQHARLPCPSPSQTHELESNSCLLKLIPIESVIPSNQLVLCCPLLLPSIFPSIQVFSNELALRIRWPKYWSFSFNLSPSNEYSGLISFRIDWFDLLAVQGALKGLIKCRWLVNKTNQSSEWMVQSSLLCPHNSMYLCPKCINLYIKKSGWTGWKLKATK